MSLENVEENVLEKQGFRIVSQAFDSWNVQFRISAGELVDQPALLKHLRRIKKAVSQRYSVPESSLFFDGILKRTQDGDAVEVVVRIRKQLYEKGNPEIHFKDGIAADKSKYTHMTALLDIMYLDEFEKIITIDRVNRAIQKASILPKFLDKEIISRKVQEVLKKKIAIKRIPIAKGKFPDIGQDAELEFFFQAMVTADNTDEYYSSRKVSLGDFLCRKKPATVGKEDGMNVIGVELPPRAGFDITLKAGRGVTLSLDENEAIADTEGTVTITRTMKQVHMLSGIKEIPESIFLKVDPVLKVDGSDVIDVATSQSVEVVGNLRMGSKIITDSEVYISGDIEEGTLVEALNDVFIEGNVNGAMLTSESNIITKKGITDSQLRAKGQIIVKGHIKNSDLSADTIIADSVSGSKITGKHEVILQRIEADENNVLSTICVGMFEFFKERILENKAFLKKAKTNMMRIELVVGKHIMDNVTTSNVPKMVMWFLAGHREDKLELRKQVDSYRKLIQSIPPTRALIEEKEKENVELLRKMEQGRDQGKNMISIRERMAAKTIFSIDGVEAEVDPIEPPIEVTSDGQDNLIVKTIDNASK
ncbi:FapA family protein [bacterium]|nr:FapA family protein [bacterium]